MRLLIVNLSEFGQFLQITLWNAIPAAIVAIMVTTFLHYRNKKRFESAAAWQPEEERANDRSGDAGIDEANDPYRGYLWMKERYEGLLEATDGRYFEMKDRLAVEVARVGELNLTIADLHVTVADLTARLEANRKILLNIHNELGAAPAAGISVETPVETSVGIAGLVSTPATPSEGAGPEPVLLAGEGSKIVGWVESVTEPTDLATEG